MDIYTYIYNVYSNNNHKCCDIILIYNNTVLILDIFPKVYEHIMIVAHVILK